MTPQGQLSPLKVTKNTFKVMHKPANRLWPNLGKGNEDFHQGMETATETERDRERQETDRNKATGTKRLREMNGV